MTADEIVKGYQFEPEQYVIVTAEDLGKIKLKSTKVIEIEGFIDATEVSPALYDAPYFAGPDGPVGAKANSLLSEALKASGKVGIGKVVLREREEVIMIGAEEGGLMPTGDESPWTFVRDLSSGRDARSLTVEEKHKRTHG